MTKNKFNNHFRTQVQYTVRASLDGSSLQLHSLTFSTAFPCSKYSHSRDPYPLLQGSVLPEFPFQHSQIGNQALRGHPEAALVFLKKISNQAGLWEMQIQHISQFFCCNMNLFSLAGEHLPYTDRFYLVYCAQLWGSTPFSPIPQRVFQTLIWRFLAQDNSTSFHKFDNILFWGSWFLTQPTYLKALRSHSVCHETTQLIEDLVLYPGNSPT